MKKSSRLTGLALVLVGAMVLLSHVGKPRMAGLHGSDVVGLVGAGMCLGVGLMGPMGRLQVGSSGSE